MALGRAQALQLPRDILLTRTVTFTKSRCTCQQGCTGNSQVDTRCYSRELTTRHNEPKAQAEQEAGSNFC